MTKIDPNKMMAQLGKMQEQMAQAQEELKTAFVEHSAGGGAVTVKASGSLEITDITIKPEAIDPDDPEMLQDLARVGRERRDHRRPGPPAAEDDGAARGLRGASGSRASSDGCVYAPSVDNLIVQLARLPGVGRRTAQRLAFHLLKASPADANRARRRDPRGEGADPAVLALLQPRRGRGGARSAPTRAGTGR